MPNRAVSMTQLRGYAQTEKPSARLGLAPVESKKGNPSGLPFSLNSGAADRNRTGDLRITNAKFIVYWVIHQYINIDILSLFFNSLSNS